MRGVHVGLSGLKAFKQGSGVVDPSAGYALYLDFKNSLYRSGATKTADVTTLPGYTYTRSGAKSELLSTGAPTAFAANVPGIVPAIGYWSRWALTNLLLGAGTATTLGTQTTAALTAVPYTIYFEGTGSVALSGSFTGSLAGTGANNMVALVFTPTAAALTVTVTGSVTYAGLVLGNYPSGAAIIATAGATASIGADTLATTLAAPTDVDQVFFAKVNVGAVPTGYVYGGQWDTGGSTRIALLVSNTGQAGVYIEAASVALYTPLGATVVANQDTILFVRRLAGDWRFGTVIGGVLTWSATATAAFPAGCVNVRSGFQSGVQQLDGKLLSQGNKIGTFTTDASVIAAVSI